jgi:hypothetical protein
MLQEIRTYLDTHHLQLLSPRQHLHLIESIEGHEAADRSLATQQFSSRACNPLPSASEENFTAAKVLPRDLSC